MTLLVRGAMLVRAPAPSRMRGMPVMDAATVADRRSTAQLGAQVRPVVVSTYPAAELFVRGGGTAAECPWQPGQTTSDKGSYAPDGRRPPKASECRNGP